MSNHSFETLLGWIVKIGQIFLEILSGFWKMTVYKGCSVLEYDIVSCFERLLFTPLFIGMLK